LSRVQKKKKKKKVFDFFFLFFFSCRCFQQSDSFHNAAKSTTRDDHVDFNATAPMGSKRVAQFSIAGVHSSFALQWIALTSTCLACSPVRCARCAPSRCFVVMGRGLQIHILAHILNFTICRSATGVHRARSTPTASPLEVLRHELHQRNATRLLRLLQRNKGLYIKVGQAMSAMAHMLPAEYTSDVARAARSRTGDAV
jgi:hypothetical protein